MIVLLPSYDPPFHHNVIGPTYNAHIRPSPSVCKKKTLLTLSETHLPHDKQPPKIMDT